MADIQPHAIAWAMAQGAPITCATCPFFHEGNMHCGKTECGGPTEGKDFPLYDGPIPREKFIERCLVCGDGDPRYMITGLDTKFGLCKKHRKVFDHITSADPGKVNYPVRVIALP